MGLITKLLPIAVNDCAAGRITPIQLLQIFQEAVNNGDILEEDNNLCVVAHVLPLVDDGTLKSSPHVTEFETKMGAKISTAIQGLRQQERFRD